MELVSNLEQNADLSTSQYLEQNTDLSTSLLETQDFLFFWLFRVILEDASCGGKKVWKKQEKNLVEVEVLPED